MKCEYCGGAVIYQLGNSVSPGRLVCMACGREPKGEEKPMDEEKKICTKCGPPAKPITEFNKNAARPDGHDSHCRVCTAQRQRDYVAMKKKKSHNDLLKGSRSEGKSIAKGKRKKQKTIDSKPAPQAVAEGILLDQQIIRAIKRSVAKEIVGIIEEKFV